jgi:hypothetical protein
MVAESLGNQYSITACLPSQGPGLFNTAIATMLYGCDSVKLRIQDVTLGDGMLPISFLSLVLKYHLCFYYPRGQ